MTQQLHLDRSSLHTGKHYLSQNKSCFHTGPEPRPPRVVRNICDVLDRFFCFVSLLIVFASVCGVVLLFVDILCICVLTLRLLVDIFYTSSQSQVSSGSFCVPLTRLAPELVSSSGIRPCGTQ